MADSSDYWSQFPLHGAATATPPLPPAATADLTKAPWTNQTDPALIPSQPGSDFGMGGMTSGTVGNGGGTQGSFNLGSLGTNTGITGGMNLSATQAPSPYATQSLGAPPPNLGMVHMQAPDGTIEPVDPAHVAHYQALGATLVNPQQMAGNQVTGQQLTGSSFGGG